MNCPSRALVIVGLNALRRKELKVVTGMLNVCVLALKPPGVRMAASVPLVLGHTG